MPDWGHDRIVQARRELWAACELLGEQGRPVEFHEQGGDLVIVFAHRKLAHES